MPGIGERKDPNDHDRNFGFGAMNVTKPYKFIGFGAMDVTEPYKFIGFGAMDVTKPYKFTGIGASRTPNNSQPSCASGHHDKTGLITARIRAGIRK
jgi:hypothetical protein